MRYVILAFVLGILFCGAALLVFSRPLNTWSVALYISSVLELLVGLLLATPHPEFDGRLTARDKNWIKSAVLTSVMSVIVSAAIAYFR